jgi:hypothetical protein
MACPGKRCWLVRLSDWLRSQLQAVSVQKRVVVTVPDIALIEALVAGTAVLELDSALVTQPASSTPEQRQGTGTVTQSEGGELRLLLRISGEVDFARSLQLSFGAISGRLIEEEEFYRIEAKRNQSETWVCERFLGKDQLSYVANASSMTGTLPRFSMKCSGTGLVAGHHLYQALVGDLPLPYFSSEVGQEPSFQFSIDPSTTARLSPRNGYVLLHAFSESGPVNPGLANRLLEALFIATGRWLHCCYRLISDGMESETRIQSYPRGKDRESLWSPLRENDPASLNQFVQSYLALTAGGPTPFFGYWQKVFSAWEAGILVAALPISIFIEGLIKEFFPDLMNETPDVIDAADKMIAHLAAAPDVDPTLIGRGQNAIQGIKQKSPTSALKKLAAADWFEESLIGRWRKVRNSSAHAHEFIATEDTEEQQRSLDGVMACLHLFYVLLFIRAQFAGTFLDLSKHGFPPTRLKPLQPSSSAATLGAENATAKPE